MSDEEEGEEEIDQNLDADIWNTGTVTILVPAVHRLTNCQMQSNQFI